MVPVMRPSAGPIEIAGTRCGAGKGPKSIAAGDLDGDGDIDITFGDHLNPNTIWLNDGAGNFSAGATFTFSGEHREYGGDMGDLNGDGALDVWQATNTTQGGHIWFNVLSEPSASLSIDQPTVAENGGVATATS